MAAKMTRFIGVKCKAAPPTLKHRPALWENMLGTVYAFDGKEVRYFDYDWDAAKRFAGVREGTGDLRVARKKRKVNYTGNESYEPSVGRLILWVLR